MAGWKANRDLYLNEDGVAVEAGDPGARFLLVRKGREISDVKVKEHKVKKTAPKKGKAK